MTTKQKIILAIVAAGFVLIVCVVAYWPRGHASAATSDTTPNSSATISPTSPGGTSTPTPTPTPTNPDASAEPKGGDDNANVIGPAETTKFKQAADKAVTAYITVKAGESPAQRAARLAPYFPAGSDYLTTLPRIANPQDLSDMKSTVTTTTDPAADILAQGKTTWTLTVFEAWQGVYANAGQPPMTVIKNGSFTVTMSSNFDGKLLTVVEPEDEG